MRRLLVALLVLVPALAYAQGQASFCGKATAATPLSTLIASGAAYASRSVTNGAITSAPTPVLAQGSVIGALILVETATIRERHDGTNPTSATGAQYGPSGAGGAVFTSCGSDLAKLRLTADTASASTVHFLFYTDGQ